MNLTRALAVLIAGNLAGLDASAAELPAGTEISASNFDQVKGSTFEGKTIASMVPEVLEWRIKTGGLKLTLANSKPVELDPRDVAATRKYAGTAIYDPKTREVTGYQGGIPFAINADDPHAAEKLVWNYYYNPLEGHKVAMNFDMLLIDGNKGLERKQDWLFHRYYLKGIPGDRPVEGDGSVLTKSIIVAQAPRDVRGLGLFTIRHDNSKVESSWAYIKSARRVRQVSGGAWMDPIGGTDYLNDDLYGWNARPVWYQKFTLLSKRWILTIGDADPKTWDAAKKGTLEEWPQVNLKDPPYWNSIGKWQPKEVYVVEAIAPTEHPYSKKILYMDVRVPKLYQVEMYDKQAKIWKHNILHVARITAEDGYHAYSSIQGVIADFKLKHASSFVSKQKINPPGMKSTDVSLEQLEANSN
jgi:hypothetical protein